MNKILLIGDSPITDSPYIGSYIEVFNKSGIPYDLLYWNRHMDETSKLPSNYVTFDKFTDNSYPQWKRLWNIYCFTRFVRKYLRKHDYSYVVVFTIAHACFLAYYLRRKYHNRYVFDIRDYSPFCGVKYLKKIIFNLINDSAFTVISSKGFLRWLPQFPESKYIVAHNTNIESILNGFDTKPNSEINYPIKLLTIGQLRDYSSNSNIIERLGNDEDYKLVFSGSGLAEQPLKDFVIKTNVKNVSFTGRYKKEDEKKMVEACDMLNIYFNHDINSDTLMSNRFYLSVLHRKPMIVRKNTFQAELVELYGLGVVLDENDDFKKSIEQYVRTYDSEKYNKGCQQYLSIIQKEMQLFESKLVQLKNK